MVAASTVPCDRSTPGGRWRLPRRAGGRESSSRGRRRSQKTGTNPFFVAAWADTLAGMGPSGGTLHAEGEWLDIPSIALQAKRSAILMSRLAREKR